MLQVVMTGGTSGFGAVAAERLRSAGARIVLASRRPPAEASPDDAASPAFDAASLASVRTFGERVRDACDPRGFDAIVLNAGVVATDDTERTVDGIERTFAVNVLANVLLVQLLLPALAAGGRIVLTTSGTHDPALHADLAPPRHDVPALLADPGRDPGRASVAAVRGQEAYTASKLCVVRLARAVADSPPVRSRGATVVAFDPGQVFGTGLARDLPRWRRIAWQALGTPLGAPLRRLSPTVNSIEAAGRALADLATGAWDPPGSTGYAALRRGRLGWAAPSVAARDDVRTTAWLAEVHGLLDRVP